VVLKKDIKYADIHLSLSLSVCMVRSNALHLFKFLYNLIRIFSDTREKSVEETSSWFCCQAAFATAAARVSREMRGCMLSTMQEKHLQAVNKSVRTLC
jgi:hypothetical protein